MTAPFPNDETFLKQIELNIIPKHHFPYVKLQRLYSNQAVKPRSKKTFTFRRSPFFKTARRFNYTKKIFKTPNKSSCSINTSATSKYPTSKFNCHICGLRLNYQVALTFHLRSHEGEVSKPYLCSLCNQSFETSNLLKIHLIEIHCYTHRIKVRTSCKSINSSPSPRYKEWSGKSLPEIKQLMTDRAADLTLFVAAPKLSCPHCPKKFPYKCNLDHHLISHSKEKLHKCSKCGSSYKYSYLLKRHKDQNICGVVLGQKIRKNFHCEQCDTTFSHLKSKNSHMRKYHGVSFSRNRPSYTCMFCGYQASSSYTLDIHNRTHTGEKPFTCDGCGHSFSTKPNLNAHIRVSCEPARKLGLGQVEKKKCSKRSLKAGLSKNFKNHDEKQLIKCSMCDQTFPRIGLKNFHETRHGDKYPCAFCPAKFAHATGLAAHKIKFHLDKLEDYQCDFCHMVFKTNSAYVIHKRSVHKNKLCKKRIKYLKTAHPSTSTTGEKNFRCEFCQMDFITQEHRTKHIEEVHEIQLNKKRDKCISCGYLDGLEDHNCSFNGDKQFPCEACGKLFAQKAYLVRHQVSCGSDKTLRPVLESSKRSLRSNYVDGSKTAEVAVEVFQKRNAGVKRKKKPVGPDPLACFDVDVPSTSTLATEEEILPIINPEGTFSFVEVEII